MRSEIVYKAHLWSSIGEIWCKSSLLGIVLALVAERDGGTPANDCDPLLEGFDVIRDNDQAVITALELVASEYGELVVWMIDILANSPARHSVLSLVGKWDVSEPEGLAPIAIRGASNLDRLERKRHWRDVEDVVSYPHLAALCDLSSCRAKRVDGIARRRRLDAAHRRIRRILARKQARERLEAFLREPASTLKIDPDWIEGFIRGE